MSFFRVFRRRRRISSAGDKVLLVVPEYDELTSSLAKWASEFSAENTVLLKGRNAGHKSAAVALNAMQGEGLIVIFAGHGDASAFLTDPKLGIRPELYGRKHSILVDADTVATFEGLRVFAYACESARDLGEFIADRNGIFIGYRELIPFVKAMGQAGIDPIFKLPLDFVWQQVSGKALLGNDTIASLCGIYDEQINRLKAGELRKDRRTSLVRMALRQHRKYLAIKGEPNVLLVN